MTQRHLHQDELNLLLDDEVGIDAAPLRAHVDECPACRAQLDAARAVLQELDGIPRLAPSFRFADRVMTDVAVLVPWHVAARNTVARYLPRSRPARGAALALITLSAATVTAGTIWVMSETDLLVFLGTVAGSRVREALVNVGGTVVVTVFGEQALSVLLQTGSAGLFAVALGFVGATIGALASLRAIAVAANRRRR